MRTLLVLLFVLPINSMAKIRTDSVMPVQLHIAPQYITRGKGFDINVYLTKNRIVYGLNGTLTSMYRAKSAHTKLYDNMQAIYFIGGTDIRIEKPLSFSLLAGLGYVHYNRIELHDYVPPITTMSYFGPITKPGYYIYDRKIKNLLGAKINIGMNLHVVRHFAIQFSIGMDINRYMKEPDFLFGVKWNVRWPKKIE